MKIDGKKLQTARTGKNLSTAQLGAKVDVSGRTIERYEGKVTELKLPLAKALAAACGVKLEAITAD